MASVAKRGEAEAVLSRRLLDGFDYTSRGNLSVHTVHAGGSTIAEVCVGTTGRTRLNFKREVVGAPPAAPRLGGSDKRWAGGGVMVTDANLEDCRRLLRHVADVARRL